MSVRTCVQPSALETAVTNASHRPSGDRLSPESAVLDADLVKPPLLLPGASLQEDRSPVGGPSGMDEERHVGLQLPLRSGFEVSNDEGSRAEPPGHGTAMGDESEITAIGRPVGGKGGAQERGARERRRRA